MEMDFYKFIFSLASLEKLVTAVYPVIISEFERRFGISVEKTTIVITHIPEREKYEVRVVIKCEKGRFYIPIASLKDVSPSLYGIEYAFKYMLPPFPK